MSLSENEPEALEPTLRTLQIIVAALILGVVTFLVIVVLVLPRILAPQGPAAAGDAPFGIGGMQMITLAALFMGASALVLSHVVPTLVTASGRSAIARQKAVTDQPGKLSPTSLASDAGRLLALFQTQTIMGAALAEGGAFFAAIAYMLEGHWVALLAALVLLGSLLTRIPTRDRLAAWLDQQLALVQEERQREM